MENNYTIVDNDLYKDYAYLDKVINKTLEEEHVTGAVFSIIFVNTCYKQFLLCSC